MKDLNKLYKEALADVINAGIKPGNILSVNVDFKDMSAWGSCNYDSENDGYHIKISDRTLADNLEDKAAMDTIAHEILHTCDSCMNHGKVWKSYTDAMNLIYKGKYHITVKETRQHKGIEFDERRYKYVIQCKHCKNKIGYMKKNRALESLKRGGEPLLCNICNHTSFSIIKGQV